MNITSMKNIVVLKNLPSNLVEEAIVVLKSNKTIKKPEYINNKSEINNKEAESKDYILKEAQMIISNFISTVEKQKDKQIAGNITAKYKRLRIVTIILSILIFMSLIASYIK